MEQGRARSGPGMERAGTERAGHGAGRGRSGPGTTGMMVAAVTIVITILRPSPTFHSTNYSSSRYVNKRHRYLSIVINKK